MINDVYYRIIVVKNSDDVLLPGISSAHRIDPCQHVYIFRSNGGVKEQEWRKDLLC